MNKENERIKNEINHKYFMNKVNKKSNYATMKNKKEKDKNKQKSEKTRDLLTEIRKNEENKYKDILSKK